MGAVGDAIVRGAGRRAQDLQKPRGLELSRDGAVERDRRGGRGTAQVAVVTGGGGFWNLTGRRLIDLRGRVDGAGTDDGEGIDGRG